MEARKVKVYQHVKQKISDFEIKNGKIPLNVREEKCNVIIRLYALWDTVARTSRIVHVLITSVYLSLCVTVLLSFFFYLQSFHCVFCFRLAFSSAKLREKHNFPPLSCCTSALLCFGNMENLEDTFRSPSRFVRS